MKQERLVFEILDRIEESGFKGYDPYDALNSPIFRSIPSKFIRIAITQLFVYSPINMRAIFGIKKGLNPKTLGLIMRSYCNLHKSGHLDEKEFIKRVDVIHEMLQQCKSTGYSGDCWGFDFPWQDLTRFSTGYIPTIVNTSTISNAYLDAFEITNDMRYYQVAESACDFICNDLNLHENERGICFSYTPIDRNIVHNASLLGSEVLFMVGSINIDKRFLDLARRAVDFSLSYQRDNGSWPYSLSPSTGKERMQIDFHQGFILDSLICLRDHPDLDPDNAIFRGSDFYFVNQFEKGMTRWRYPRKLPRDIHHQAQGIITSFKLFDTFRKDIYLDIHENIVKRTLKNFVKKDKKVTYQITLMNNNIQYIRWSLSWTVLAMSYSMRLI